MSGFEVTVDLVKWDEIANSPDDPLFADAPVLLVQPHNREWAMIGLVDLQTATAFGRKPGQDAI